VGETVAALEAAEGAAQALDPAIRTTLAAIARDEARHAELAWDFVAWALEQRPELAAAAREAFAAATADKGPSATFDLATAGVVGGARRGIVRAVALRDAVFPLEKALLAA
jgi:hypothetical protein